MSAPRCICDFDLDAGCDGSNLIDCGGCGGDICLCAFCGGAGQTECPGCDNCRELIGEPLDEDLAELVAE